MQGISPGLVRTEFGPRMNKKVDIEQGKKDYDKMVDGVSDEGSVGPAVYIACFACFIAAIGGRRYYQLYCLCTVHSTENAGVCVCVCVCAWVCGCVTYLYCLFLQIHDILVRPTHQQY